MTKIAVVTGASGGIGPAICRALGADGFDIVAQYRSGLERANQLAAELKAESIPCHLLRADLAERGGVDSVISCVKDVLQSDPAAKVGALVNNAGRLLGPSFEEMTPDLFDDYVAVNTRAPLFLVQGLSRMMQPGASIVNISSASAHIASAGDIIYAMTKSALESLTRSTAEALAPRGIRVNAVVPGFTANGHPAFADESALAYMSGLSMLGGVANPHHVADAVSFLVSDKAGRTTGALLDVTGGMTLHPRPHRSKSLRDLL